MSSAILQKLKRQLLVVATVLTASSCLTATHLLAGAEILQNSSASLYSGSVYCAARQDGDRSCDSFGDPASLDWRWRYLDEHAGGFEVLVRDPSLLQRLANNLYLSNMGRMFNADSNRLNSGDPQRDQDIAMSMAGPRVDANQCGRDLAHMIELQLDLKRTLDAKRNSPSEAATPMQDSHIRLARVLDSFGRYETAGLSGKWFYPGSSSQCLRTHLLLPASDGSNPAAGLRTVQTRMCSARLSLKSRMMANMSIEQTPGLSFHYGAHNANVDPVLVVGLCLPATCHSLVVGPHLQLANSLLASQFKFPDNLYLESSIEIESVFCQADSDSPAARLPFVTQLFICVIIMWFLLLAYVSFFQDQPKFTWMPEALATHLVFSLDARESINQYFKIQREQQNSSNDSEKVELDSKTDILNLDAMFPLKVLGCLGVVGFHVICLQTVFTNKELELFYIIDKSFLFWPAMALVGFIDSFFVVSGILLGFSSVSKITKPPTKDANTNLEPTQTSCKSFYCLKYIKWLSGESWLFFIDRYVRLVPLYVIVHWSNKMLFARFGSGQLWDGGHNQATVFGACEQESYLTPFTFMAAYIPLSRSCLPHTWSVAGDLFFAVFLAPLPVLMVHNKPAAVLISVLLAVGNLVLWPWQLSQLGPEFTKSLAQGRIYSMEILFSSAGYLYTAAHYRIVPIVVGIFTGVYWHSLRQSMRSLKDKQVPKLPRWITGFATYASIGFIGLMVMVLLSMQYLLTLDSGLGIAETVTRHGYSTLRICWCLANAILFTRLCFDLKGSWFGIFCLLPIWKTMARLCYPIYLVHLTVLYFDFQMAETIREPTIYEFLRVTIVGYFLCCLLALVLHLLFEVPLAKLLLGPIIMLRKHRYQNSTKAEQTLQLLRLETTNLNNNNHVTLA